MRCARDLPDKDSTGQRVDADRDGGAQLYHRSVLLGDPARARTRTSHRASSGLRTACAARRGGGRRCLMFPAYRRMPSKGATILVYASMASAWRRSDWATSMPATAAAESAWAFSSAASPSTRGLGGPDPGRRPLPGRTPLPSLPEPFRAPLESRRYARPRRTGSGRRPLPGRTRRP